MNEMEFAKQLEQIFLRYVKILEGYENTFRVNLARRIPTLTASQLYRLPMEMYMEVKDLQNESTMMYIFSNMSDKYAQDYYEKTVQSFMKSGKLLDSDSQDAGFVFEALLISALKNIEGSSEASGSPSQMLSALKSKYDFQGIGIQGHHGDIAITFKGLELPIYIDAKYSTDRSQIIDTTSQKWNGSTDLAKQIIAEIHRGIGQGIAYNPKKDNDQWVRLYIAAQKQKDAGNIEQAKEIYKKGYLVPKTLIYIFKDKGMWSSEVVDELKGQVINNALSIKRKNGQAFIKGGDTKGFLWYGKSRF